MLLTLVERGQLAQRMGDHAQALVWLARAEDFAATIGRRDWDARLALVQGRTWWAVDERERAAVCWRQGLARARDLNQAIVVAEGLEDIARPVMRADPVRAAQLLGAAGGLRAANGLGRAPADASAYASLVAGLASRLDNEFSCARAAGESLSLQAAIEDALAP
jgi:hypothetical protein